MLRIFGGTSKQWKRIIGKVLKVKLELRDMGKIMQVCYGDSGAMEYY